MATSKQLHHIATNPSAYMKFRATGHLPTIVRPRSPLIDLLVQLSPRDRIAITGLTVNDVLGYSGSRMFRSAEAALRWIQPSEEMLESQSWPARSWQNKRFAHVITLDALLAHASAYPPGLVERYPRLRAEVPRPNPEPAQDTSGIPPAPEPAP